MSVCNSRSARARRLILTTLALAIGLCLVGMIWPAVTVAQAPDPALDDRVHDLAKQMNCPTCAGRNLADCPTDTCKQWKDEVRSQLEAGKSDNEVLDYFKTRFGPTVMQEPPREGALLVVWVAPIVAAAALIAAGVWVARRSASRKSPAESGPAAVSDDPYVAALEEQVRQS